MGLSHDKLQCVFVELKEHVTEQNCVAHICVFNIFEPRRNNTSGLTVGDTEKQKQRHKAEPAAGLEMLHITV